MLKPCDIKIGKILWAAGYQASTRVAEVSRSSAATNNLVVAVNHGEAFQPVHPQPTYRLVSFMFTAPAFA